MPRKERYSHRIHGNFALTLNLQFYLAEEIQLGHKNKGNDHQLKKLFMVKQILLVST